MRRRWSCTANADAFPSSPMRVPAVVQITSDKTEVAEVTQGAFSLHLKATGFQYVGQKCRACLPVWDRPSFPLPCPRSSFFQQGWAWDAPRIWGWASRKWHRIRWDIICHHVFKPCTPWESQRRGMSNSTAQKHMCFHCITHLKPRWRGHPAQGDCDLKRKKGRLLTTCVCIAIIQRTLEFVIQFQHLRAVCRYFKVASILHKFSILLLKRWEINNPGTEVREKLIAMKGWIPERLKLLNHRYWFLCLQVLSQFLSCHCSWWLKTNYSKFPLTLQPQLHYWSGVCRYYSF